MIMKDNIPKLIVFWALLVVLTLVPGRDTAALATTDKSVNSPQSDQYTALTLILAKQIALENSPTLASSLERINQAREGIKQAKANYLPVLSATAGWDYTEKTENSNSTYDETLYTDKISATQILFDGFYRKYVTLSAEYGEKINLAAREEAKRQLAWSVAQTFLNVQLARENMTITRSDIEFNKKQEVEAIAKEKAGTGSYSDVLNFKTKVNSARSSLLSATQDLVESTYGLAALLGYEDARLPEAMAIAPLNFKNPDLENPRAGSVTQGDEMVPESELTTLFSQRPDLKEASLAVEDADAGIKMAKADYFPTISLTAAYGTAAGDSFNDSDKMGASLGVNVSIDLFSGGAKKSRVREAVSYKREREKDLEDARINAVSDIRSSIRNISTAKEQLALQQENTRLIEETRDLVKKEYNAGQVSLVRLNEAQNELINAMGDLAIARVSLILAMEEFDYYTADNIN